MTICGFTAVVCSIVVVFQFSIKLFLQFTTLMCHIYLWFIVRCERHALGSGFRTTAHYVFIFLKGIKKIDIFFPVTLQIQSVPSIGKQSNFVEPLTLKAGIKHKGKFYDSRPQSGRKQWVTVHLHLEQRTLQWSVSKRLSLSRDCQRSVTQGPDKPVPVLTHTRRPHAHTLWLEAQSPHQRNTHIFASPPKHTSHTVANEWQC